jgi:glycerol-3-phosphate acyltransferase PlsX
MVTISIDAMGGDFGPNPIVNGVIEALKEEKFKALLFGDPLLISPLIPKKLQKYVTIIESTDVISMSDGATDALKRKDSSIYMAVESVREQKSDAVVSMGHSGATMSLATLKIGRIKGILRPAIATLMPTIDSTTLVLDVGANVDCKSEHLAQFAILGQAYSEDVLGIYDPKVGLLSNGEEQSKGNELTKDAFNKLSKIQNMNFVGNVEGNNIFDSSVDVVVCDGFVGNILLKTSEGVADTISGFIKSRLKRAIFAAAGALLMKRVFKLLRKKVDYAEYGGAPLLGVNQCVIIGHGKSNSKAVKNAIFQAIRYSESNISKNIQDKLTNISS